MRISYSLFDTYTRCPLKYKFNYIDHIKVPQKPEFFFGSLIHEVVQMALLPGYKTGGTLHLVVNNQVGFTTDYLEARSSTYCTDVAKVTRSPVFHVNGDDVEALIFTVKLALEFRPEVP